MLIEINNDVIKNIKAQTDPQVLHALNNIANARRLGKHIVFAEPGVLEYLAQCEDIDQSSRKIYQYLFANFSQMGSYRGKFIRSIEIVGEENKMELVKTEQGNKIIVSAHIFDDFRLANEVTILAENLTEINLFKKIMEIYIKCSNYGNINISYQPSNGGGATISQVYENIQSYQKDLCICVVDSDKKFPECKGGETYRKLREVDDPQQCLCDILPIESHEVENIIPIEIYEEILKGDVSLHESLLKLKKMLEVDAEVIKYFDFKKGIEISSLVNKDKNKYYRKYWEKILYDGGMSKEYIEILEKIIVLSEQEQKECEEIILKGFGQKILKRVIAYLSKNDLESILKNCPFETKEELKYIGQLLISWCCGSERVYC